MINNARFLKNGHVGVVPKFKSIQEAQLYFNSQIMETGCSLFIQYTYVPTGIATF